MTLRTRVRTRILALVVVALVGAGLAAIVPADAAVKAAPSPCGTTVVKKADGTPWTCTWGDDFTGSFDSSKWFVQTSANSGFNAGNACYTDSTQNVTQSFGVLKLVARKVNKAFVCTSAGGNFTTNYTAGTVSTFNRFSQTYGRVEIRAKFPTSKIAGLQSALWMYPTSPTQPWPYSGEIDIAEWYSQYPDLVIPFLHYGTSYLDPNATTNTCKVANVGGAWHTYALEWTKTSMSFIYDGKTCLTNTAVAGQYPFAYPYMIVLSQLLGVGSNAPTARTALPATTQIDYVHVWS